MNSRLAHTCNIIASSNVVCAVMTSVQASFPDHTPMFEIWSGWSHSCYSHLSTSLVPILLELGSSLVAWLPSDPHVHMYSSSLTLLLSC